jgi:hypothetical protein
VNPLGVGALPGRPQACSRSSAAGHRARAQADARPRGRPRRHRCPAGLRRDQPHPATGPRSSLPRDVPRLGLADPVHRRRRPGRAVPHLLLVPRARDRNAGARAGSPSAAPAAGGADPRPPGLAAGPGRDVDDRHVVRLPDDRLLPARGPHHGAAPGTRPGERLRDRFRPDHRYRDGALRRASQWVKELRTSCASPTPPCS